jgi:ribonuclease HI
VIKVNVDAGWDAATKHGGIGVLARDQRGRVLVTEWKFISVCGSAEEAEIMACLEGLRLLIELRQ